ncbi:T9SS type B sorting domain-containing protein [Flavobacterium sp. 3-210]
MKKTTFLRATLLLLFLSIDFALCGQNLAALDFKARKDYDIFLSDPYHSHQKQIRAHVGQGSDFIEESIKNPIIKYAQSPYAGVVSQCPDDGSMLPKLFLCGVNDSRLIQTGITDAMFVKWQRRTGGCQSSRGDCANKDLNCTWADAGEGPDYLANSSGEFRVKIRNANNTETIFYFNVYKNELDPNQITKSDITTDTNGCELPGQIMARGFNESYEYSCTTNPGPDSWQDSNVFSVSNPGSYNIFVRLKAIDGGCIFSVKNIEVRSNEFSSSLTASQPFCSGEKGSIKVVTNAANKQLKYELYKEGNPAPISTIGPVLLSEYEFIGLDPGSYRVVSAVDGTCAVDQQTTVIKSFSKIINNSKVSQVLTACNNGTITGAASGGTAPYRYSVNIDDSGFQYSPNGNVTVMKGGTYIIRVEDVNGCTTDKTISIPAVVKPEYTIKAINGKCGENSSIEVNLANANGFIVQYSKDNGANFINGTASGVIFNNLVKGEYSIVVRYSKNGVNNGSSCSDKPQIVNIGASTPLTASAGIGSLSGCGPASDPSQGIARITNPQGGTPFAAPNFYRYSFDNQVTWVTQNEGLIKPGGPYSVFIKDAADCVYEMAGLQLDPKPAPPAITTNGPVYNCDGTADYKIIINGGNGDPKYSYQFYIDGQPNPNKADPGSFLNLPPGDHYLTVDYNVQTVSTYSNLLDESFGSGENTTSPGINSFYYCFEKQLADQPDTYCNGSYAINDGDYSVTSSIDKTATADWNWRYPKDHTSNGQDPKGRFLAVNIGDKIPETTILYEKRIDDVIPNQPINFDFYAMNLMMPYAGNEDPNLRIALVDAKGDEISWFATGPIARSATDSDWKHFPEVPMTLNPGNNTSLRLIIRSNVRQSSGNDVAIDDIKVFQVPKSCGAQSLFKVKINENKIFNARVENSAPVKCKGDSSGALSIYAENFSDTFQYSVDGQPWISSAVSPVTINGLQARAYSVKVRYNDSSPDCDFDIPSVVASSETFLVDASATPASCSEGAVVKASAVGGTPPYSFILRDAAGNDTAFLSDGNGGGILKKILPGRYAVLGIDKNSCYNNSQEVNLDITASEPPKAVIDRTKVLCFDDESGAAITVNISGGTPPFTYKVSRDGGKEFDAFRPSFPERSFTFAATLSGPYEFIVMDANGCQSADGIIVYDQLAANAVLAKNLTCEAFPQNAATIAVSATGGSGVFAYRVKSNSGTFEGEPISFEGASFEYSAIASGKYIFELTDSKGCRQETQEIIVSDPEIVTVSYTTTSPRCKSGSDGTISFDTQTGSGPFLFSIDNGQTFTNTSKFGGLPPGTYNYQVKDSKGCSAYGKAVVADPPALNMNIKTNGMTCDPMKNGSFDVNISGGGDAPYNYYLYDNSMKVIDSYTAKTAADAAAVHKFEDLPFGDYYVNAVDVNGCEFKSNKMRIEPPPYLEISGTIAGATCTEGISVTLEVTGGTGPEFTYNIYGIGTTSGAVAAASYTFEKLDQNMTYIFEVIDSNGCKSYMEMKTPRISNIAIDPISATHITCNGADNGEVTFTVSQYDGSSLRYEVRDNLTNKEVVPSLGGLADDLSGDPFTVTLKGLKPGNYSLYVKEMEGSLCSASEIFQIEQPISALSAEITSASNANCQSGALVTVKAMGGTGPYLYAAAASPAVPTAFGHSNVLELAGSESDWNITVKDANGCTFQLNKNIARDQDPVVALSVVDRCAGQNEFAIHIAEIQSGKTPYSIRINNAGFTPIGALPYDITGLSAGDYTIAVKDDNGCEDIKSIKIEHPIKLNASVVAHPGCEGNNGEVSLISSGGSGSYSYSVNPSHPGILIAGNKITGLAADNYRITITDDQSHCTTDTDVSLSAATPVRFQTAAVNATCNGAENGSITVSISPENNNPPYTYSISGAAITPISDQASSEFTNLPAGSYNVAVKSSRGCTDQMIVNIAEPQQIEVTANSMQYSCQTDSNGFNYAVVSADDVKGGGYYLLYQFFRDGIEVQNGPSNVYREYDHKGGSYLINVYDRNNCIGKSNEMVIRPFAVMKKINIKKVSPITCEDFEAISVDVDYTGGAVDLVYHLEGVENTMIEPQTNATGEFEGLGIGDYLITVENRYTDCSIAEYYHVSDPNTFEIQVRAVNAEICYGTDDGSVELTMVDRQPFPDSDAGVFDYTITGPMPAVSGRSNDAGPIGIKGLIAGEYTVVAKLVSNPKCEVKTGFQITQPSSRLDLELQSTAITCGAGKNDGAIMAAARGGSTGAAYQYELIGPVSSAYSEEYHFQHLIPGHYTVNVKDGKGCIASSQVDLRAPDPIRFAAYASSTVLTCYGDNNAIISVSDVSGGRGSNYQYILNYIASTGEVISTDPQQSNEFKGLASGNYTVKVTDGGNCESTSDVITISDPEKIESSLAQSRKATCQSDATLTLKANGGRPPYTYSEDGINYGASFASEVTFSVKPGLHQYWVKDYSGCVSELSGAVQVEALLPLSVELDSKYAKVNCRGEATAMITAQSRGGMGDYRYSLLDKNGVEIRPAQSSGIFDALAADSSPYTVQVRSGNCQIYSEAVKVTESDNALTSDYAVSHVSCFGENNGSIDIRAQGGTGTIKYAISPNLGMFVESGKFLGLAKGSYTVLVQDVLGCTNIYKDIEISEPSFLRASEIPDSRIPEICKGDKNGAFFIEIRGGTAPYSESLDDQNGPYNPVNGFIKDYQNQAEGKHTVYIRDANGCTSEVEIEMAESVVLNPTVEIQYDCVSNNQYSMVTVSVDKSNTDSFEIDYSLDSDQGPWQPNNVFTTVAPGRHFVAARHTNGCIARSESFDIRAYSELSLELSLEENEMNVIAVHAQGGVPSYEYSFNGEPFTSSNTYKIYKSGGYEVVVRDRNGCTKTMTVAGIYIDICISNYFTPNGDGVYDTWGPGCTNIYDKLEFSVFDRYGRLINNYHYGQRWDGRYKGAELPSGDYWYVLKLNDERDNREFRGHFTLYR